MFFFFKAEDGIRDLVRSVGSEMCIRDRVGERGGEELVGAADVTQGHLLEVDAHQRVRPAADLQRVVACLLYTSDAADERSSVDLGGRRIIKKKNNIHYTAHSHT